MHRVWLGSVLSLVVVTGVLAQHAAPGLPGALIGGHPLVQGLVAWYPLLPHLAGGRTLWDLAGRSHGTSAGALAVGDPSGRFAGVLRFDGVDDSVTIPNAPALNFGTGPFSVCLFFRMPTIPVGGVSYSLVYKAPFYELTPGWSFEVFAPDTNELHADFRITNGLNVDNQVYDATGGPPGPTYHVCGTRSGQTGSLYVNGRLVSVTSNTGMDDNVDNVEPIELASPVATWIFVFPGEVSDLRLYTRALTAPEVFQLATCQALDYCGTVLQDDVLALAGPRRPSVNITNY